MCRSLNIRSEKEHTRSPKESVCVWRGKGRALLIVIVAGGAPRALHEDGRGAATAAWEPHGHTHLVHDHLQGAQ